MSGVFAKEIITGMQGKGLPGSSKYALILAGAKHFSMFDGPKNGGMTTSFFLSLLSLSLPRFLCVPFLFGL